MKLKIFFEGLAGKDPHFVDCVEKITDIWTNEACAGYCIAAARSSGMNRKQILKLVEALRSGFDELTVTEAERVFRTF